MKNPLAGPIDAAARACIHGERAHLARRLDTRPRLGDHHDVLTVADTAYSIAVIRAEESERPAPERLFEDPYASHFAAAGAHAREGTERYLALPFFRDGIRLRTRYIDDAVREGLAAGLDQVVLLGAGFDCRGLRMPEIAARGASVYEVDFAEQLDHKRAILGAAGVTLPPHVAYVPCDFAADFGEALAASLAERGFRLGAGAIFVWEGVLGYIDDVAIDRSLAFMVRAGGPGTRLVLTCGHGGAVLERARRAGFTAAEDHGCDALWRRYLPGEPHENAWVSRLGTAVV
jgi:methyltransferase (TIGR00027 family)